MATARESTSSAYCDRQFPDAMEFVRPRFDDSDPAGV
jgi:hypothetical protein